MPYLKYYQSLPAYYNKHGHYLKQAGITTNPLYYGSYGGQQQYYGMSLGPFTTSKQSSKSLHPKSTNKLPNVPIPLPLPTQSVTVHTSTQQFTTQLTSPRTPPNKTKRSFGSFPLPKTKIAPMKPKYSLPGQVPKEIREMAGRKLKKQIKQEIVNLTFEDWELELLSAGVPKKCLPKFEKAKCTNKIIWSMMTDKHLENMGLRTLGEKLQFKFHFQKASPPSF